MKTTTRWSIIVALGAALTAGCPTDNNSSHRGDGGGGGGGGGGTDALCVQAASTLNACFATTEFNVDNVRCEDITASEYDRCFAACALTVSCADLEILVCDDDATPAVEECDTTCTPPDFTCLDGGGTISGFHECDGDIDCADASDELGCDPTTVFACGSGIHIEAYLVCDGFDDCADGSDEAACATFSCTDGSATILETQLCDFFEDCGDGEDESGCDPATIFVCTSGEHIPEFFVCDDVADCVDSSDEPDTCPTDPFDSVCDGGGGNGTDPAAVCSNASAGVYSGQITSLDPVYEPWDPESHFDSYCLTLTAGQTLTATTAAGLSGTPIDDTVLILLDDAGDLVTWNDDNAVDLYSELSFTVVASGSYVLVVLGFDGFELGTYELTISIL